MSVQRPPDVPLKAAVTVAEMARMVGLSRARFYQLVHDGIFPVPVYAIETRRPLYLEEQQKLCLQVRRHNCGVNGHPILFYTTRTTMPVSKPRSVRNSPVSLPKQRRHASLIAALEALGLNVTVAQVECAMAGAFPNGTDGVEEGDLIRGCYRQLKRQDSADNVRR